MEDQLKERIARALYRIAIRRGVLSYQRFHDLCGAGPSYGQRYDALDKAVESLSDPHLLDYGVLLALDSGLPGDDYFRRFYRYRHDEYLRSMGDPRIQRQSAKQKWAHVHIERSRVYEDARCRDEARSAQAVQGCEMLAHGVAAGDVMVAQIGEA